LSELKSGEVRQIGCGREKVSAADNLQGRGPTGYLSYSIITRWKPPPLSYHICHVRHDGHDTTVLSKSIHSCRYDIKMTLVVAASRRGEGRGGEFASRRVCSVCFGKSCDIISRDQDSDVLCQASLLQSVHCQNQQSHVFSYSCCRSAGNFP
jgi:hypothetical protein